MISNEVRKRAKIQVKFIERRLEQEFYGLKKRNPLLYEWLERAFRRLLENPFIGIPIPKKKIPKEYIRKYHIDNLLKYKLPKGWRLFYSITRDEILIVAWIIEWLTHKEYERKIS